jgi:hypothetical protein
MAGKSEELELVPPTAPRGWYLAGSEPTHYESGVDTAIAHSGSRCAYLQPAVEYPEGFGTLMQCFATQKHLGKRVRMNLWLKTEDVERWAAAWMRVDGEGQGKMLAFDNMCSRRLNGTNDWKKFDIVLDVPLGSTNICFGAMLSGNGKIWVDDISFDEVDDDVEVTDCPCMNREKRSEPRNLNFEEKESE